MNNTLIFTNRVNKIRLLVFYVIILIISGNSYNMYGQSVTGVTAKDFFEHHMDLIHDLETLVIDGRTDEMFAGGHIENSVNIDADMENLEDELKKHINVPRIVVYCTTNRRTYDIIYVLEKIYKGEIMYISDGITGWRTNGFPENKISATEKK